MMMAAIAARMTITADARGFAAGGPAFAGALNSAGGGALIVLMELSPMSAGVMAGLSSSIFVLRIGAQQWC